MDPVEIDDLQREFLPAHVTLTIAKDQPPYRPLPIVLLEGPQGRCISRWTLTPEERASIAAGEDIYIEQLTFNALKFTDAHRGAGYQPILPTVGLRTFCPADTQ